MFRRMLSGASKADRLAVRAAFIPKGSRLVPGPAGGVVYTYEGEHKWYAMVFRGTSARSEWHVSFRTEQQRADAIAKFHNSLKLSADYRAKRDAARKAGTCAFKTGDIVNTSWGYDQTNVDFYIVTRTTAACVWVRRVAADGETTGHMSGRTWPKMPIEMLGPETRHVCRGDSFSIDGHGASLTTGDTYESWYA